MEQVQKKSRQRAAIMKTLAGTQTHPGAEWVYAKLKPDFPGLSLGTVYRNLARFRDEGLIVPVANVRGQERYDANTSAHAHFICDVCGEITDIAADMPLNDCAERAAGEIGARVERADLIFRGICLKCAKDHSI